ncbi:MAG: hypothetical protein OSB19_05310 [Opitutaceae bacterium]|nr:hypothetical protein [Opitutaceae bacterium]
MKRKKRETQVFSLSFLDVICCGFGAVLLLFVLTVGKKSDTMDKIEVKIQVVLGQMENEISSKDKELKDLHRSLSTIRDRNHNAEEEIIVKVKMQTELEDEFALLLAQLSSMEEDLGKLIDDKENLPKQEEKPPIPILNPIRRQYLTGFDIQGDNVVFLIEASGGMMDDTPEAASGRLSDTDDEKRESPKWMRVKKGMRWLIATLKPSSRYKVIIFNDEIDPLQTSYGVDWMDPSDRKVTKEVLDLLEEVVPENGANLEKAFSMVSDLPIEPDRIVLIVDGLPTLSDSYTTSSVVDDHDRINMFRVAKKALTIPVPVNVLLYPMKNDPGAAVHFWRLADDQGGAMVCPSRTWPNT